MDDEPELSYLFKDALSHVNGVSVLTFTDPLMAIEHFRLNHRNYGLILSDYRMPGMNGIELLLAIRNIDPSPARILISAFEVEDAIFKECDCVSKFLRKPISMETVIDEVEDSLRFIISN